VNKIRGGEERIWKFKRFEAQEIEGREGLRRGEVGDGIGG